MAATCYGPCNSKQRILWGDAMKRAHRLLGLSLLPGLAVCGLAWAAPQDDYRHYNGDAGGMRHSRLTQITPRNVSKLKEAWRYDLGRDGQLQNTPIMVDGVLYGAAMGKVFALDA